MTSQVATLRAAIAQAINTKKAANGYVFNGFMVEETWLPYEKLENLAANYPEGKLYLIGLGFGQGPTLSRGNLTLNEIAVMIGYQRKVDPDDLATIDQCVELIEQLQDTIRNDVSLSGYSWNRTEPLRDENETPFALVGLRDVGLFEAYFTAYFKTPRS